MVIFYNHNVIFKKATMTSPDLQIEIRGEQQEIAVIRLTRGKKRNAINDVLTMMAAIAQSAPEAKQRVRDFLEGKAGTKVQKS